MYDVAKTQGTFSAKQMVTMVTLVQYFFEVRRIILINRRVYYQIFIYLCILYFLKENSAYM